MSEAVKFFDQLLKEMSDGLRCCMLARIERFDPAKMEADVVPLHKRKLRNGKEEEFPMILSCPVAHLKAGPFMIRPPYKKGDNVVVAFNDYSLEETILTGSQQTASSHRRHALDDAIVISGIMPFSAQYPAQHGNDLLIAKDNLAAKIVITENNQIIIESSGPITIKGSKINFSGSQISLN